MATRIEVERVGKRYVLQHAGKSHHQGSLRDALSSSVKRLLRREAATGASREEFWALQDVSFKLEEGTRLGIIGRNGAGKSTLLKILSRVTEPTRGVVRMRGRVASLLEVGTGFHPELTGRENIFLNGAVLGMRRDEIKGQFDAIVDFAEIERFLDTPVKHYSSGMYMRLAFAVAAHLRPEILIVDEVLAVGDSKFQRKCLGKMQEVGSGGRTVLFVSHNIGAIRQLCDVAMVLEAGRSLGVMPCEEAVSLYQTRQREAQVTTLGTGPLRIRDVRLNRISDETDREAFTGDPLRISFAYDCDKPGSDLLLCVSITPLATENHILYSTNHLEEAMHRCASAGEANIEFPSLPLSPGRYALNMQAYLDGILEVRETRALEFEIHPVPCFNSQTLHQSFPAQLMASARWNFRT